MNRCLREDWGLARENGLSWVSEWGGVVWEGKL